MRRTIHPGSRGGFTLVELLVVVTIIAVLIALISSGVMAALSRGTETSVRNEVTQLANAVQAFKAQFQVQYIPDKLVLPPGYDAGSKQWISSVWTRIYAGPLPTDVGPLSATTSTFTRNGSAYTLPNNPNNNPFSYWQVSGSQPVVLHGDQVLVWALGGWRDVNSNNVFGFNTDPTDPMKPYVQGTQRHGPFFDGFTSDRLKYFGFGKQQVEVSKPPLPKRANSFPSFVDYYGKMPYLYFSSGKAGNDYPGPLAAPTEDPNTPFIPVFPYKLASNKFANPTGFQIICAGKDALFGGGDVAWSGGPGGQVTVGGKDDIANFSATKLGD
jgi:prepilin-type N-terminal cleavage/methylation domain-containing protein